MKAGTSFSICVALCVFTFGSAFDLAQTSLRLLTKQPKTVRKPSGLLTCGSTAFRPISTSRRSPPGWWQVTTLYGRRATAPSMRTTRFRHGRYHLLHLFRFLSFLLSSHLCSSRNKARFASTSRSPLTCLGPSLKPQTKTACRSRCAACSRTPPVFRGSPTFHMVGPDYPFHPRADSRNDRETGSAVPC